MLRRRKSNLFAPISALKTPTFSKLRSGDAQNHDDNHNNSNDKDKVVSVVQVVFNRHRQARDNNRNNFHKSYIPISP